jgi:RNA polymerase sigma-70 factor (ECF subfamily)
MTTTTPPSNVWYIQDLVQRANQKDQAAFGELYERYAPRVQSYMTHHLNGRAQEAEDLTADVFAKVFERLDRYEFRGVPFSAWLFRVARNQLVDYMRRRPRAPQVALDEALEVRLAGTFQGVDRRLAADQITGAMKHLTEEQQRVIELRFMEGRSTSQTAALTGKSEEAVKKLQARGLASLRRTMDCPSGCWKIDLDAN